MSKRWLPASGCIFHAKVTNHRFDKANHHPGIVPITLGELGASPGTPLKESLRFS